MKNKVKAETKTLSAPKFFKDDLLKSDRYSSKRDVLTVVLKDNVSYTLEQVDKLVSIFLNEKGVK